MKLGQMQIQTIAQEILKKNGIDPAKEFYLKLSKPNYDDLVIERCGNDVFVGHYFNQNGDRVPDPVLVMDYNCGYWFPVRIGPIKAIEELIRLGIERCPECHCAVGDDWDYKDFSNKTIVVCPQCGEEIRLDDKNGKGGKQV